MEKKVFVKRRNHSQRVLVIEDNADLRHFIAGFLSENYQVIEAENGLEGYQKALETLPDLIISDVMMPGLDGVSLCEKVKKDERTSHIPIILLTAKADTESKVNGLQTGADDYLTKPFNAQELLLRVHNLLERQNKLRKKFSRTLSLQPSEIIISTTEEQFLQKILSIIERNIANTSFDIELFSREAGMSLAQLTRKLTVLSGQAPNELIRTMRLKRAAQLLERSSGTIAEIAFRVGFNNPNFRDYYGVAPSEYVPSTPLSEKNNS
jgi:DNA-binding response OmpR family regulator